MTKQTKPRVHLLFRMVRYQDFILNGVEFSQCWGTARVGRKYIGWEGNAGGEIRLFLTTRSKATAHYIRMNNSSGDEERCFSNLRAIYQRDFLPKLVTELQAMAVSGVKEKTFQFHVLAGKPG